MRSEGHGFVAVESQVIQNNLPIKTLEMTMPAFNSECSDRPKGAISSEVRFA